MYKINFVDHLYNSRLKRKHSYFKPRRESDTWWDHRDHRVTGRARRPPPWAGALGEPWPGWAAQDWPASYLLLKLLGPRVTQGDPTRNLPYPGRCSQWKAPTSGVPEMREQAEQAKPFSSSDVYAQSCLTLWDPMDWAHQALLTMGFPRQEYWSRLPFPTPE